MQYKQPAALHPGDTIAIVAPSAALADDSAQKGLEYIRSLGYKIKLSRSVTAHAGYLAGSDELRASDINSAFADDEVNAILCLRGGYGATRLLPLLDYETIAAHPKLFVGFSDITALHTVFLQRCGFSSIHGTMVMSIGRGASEYTKQELSRGLTQPFAPHTLALPENCQPETLVPGQAEGPLYGTNMMLLTTLLGTPYALDGTGGILALEEVGEEAYAIDRMLCQLEESGLIERIKGLAFGEFYHCGPNEDADYEWTVKEVITAYAKKWGKPAVWGLPFGHGKDNAWLPLGQNVRLDAGAKPALTLGIR